MQAEGEKPSNHEKFERAQPRENFCELLRLVNYCENLMILLTAGKIHSIIKDAIKDIGVLYSFIPKFDFLSILNVAKFATKIGKKIHFKEVRYENYRY